MPLIIYVQQLLNPDLDIHLIHLGTMGVYGYETAGMKIPEGYLKLKLRKEDRRANMEILYPAHPGSIYHMTKNSGSTLFLLLQKNDKLRVTDLHR